MALNSASLQAALLDLMTGKYVFPGEDTGRWATTSIEAGKAWAAIYASYAAGATSCKGMSPASLAAAEATLGAALGAAFAGASVANGMAAAFTGAWLAPPVAFAPDGAVTAVAGTSALSAALIAFWAAGAGASYTAAFAATTHGVYIDTFSHTVLVTHVAPPTCASPLL